ncbi:AMP-binding protein [Nocardia transvalensis]|uniref:AMP-binding protein n=1 Tax=Nocardia transvalensis TaxID=37333 RepID=UPI001893F66F|nr:AMP-binding protein [Nocardia transvalensis]MBF6328875.1 AMP-binding protein [Nocardia transvalensis]
MNSTVDELAAAVARWASDRPDTPACIALTHTGRDRSPTALTYRELHSAAGALAERIRSLTAPDDRVAILCRHGTDYVVAFLACLYSNRVAVPLYPMSQRNAGRLASALRDAAPTLLLTSAGAERPSIEGDLAFDRTLTVSIHDRPDEVVIDPVADHPAYLQYSGGAEGTMVTHANLAAALEQLRTRLPVVGRKPVVGWLPYHHDLGLVVTLALPLYSGVAAITLPPTEFIERPIRWLRACGDYRAGTTASPNSGLTLAVSATTADERADLDLSELELLLGGAEPSRAEALSAFTRSFAPYGFRHRAHTPCYGPLTATRAVTCTEPDDEPVSEEFDRLELAAGRAVPAPDGVALTGYGTSLGQSVRVVDPIRHCALGAGRVGEIWVAGPTVCAGHFRRPRSAAFRAALPRSAEAWLRTGDLGFFHNGQLYVAGRLKDMIVIGDHSHYPADIEATAADSSPDVRGDRIAAFGIDDGEHESLVVVAEIDDQLADPADVVRRIHAAVAAAHDITPTDVVLVPRGQLPKTTDAPRRRSECRTRYRNGALARVGDPAASP